MKKIEKAKIKNGYKSYPKTIVEAVLWDREKKMLGDALDELNPNRPDTDGMGYKILCTDTSFASQVTDADTIYEIRYDFDLGGASVPIPAGCVLKFVGGELSNGTIILDGTFIHGDGWCASDLSISGAPAEAKGKLSWFSGTDNAKLLKALSLYSIWKIFEIGHISITSSISLTNFLGGKSGPLLRGRGN